MPLIIPNTTTQDSFAPATTFGGVDSLAGGYIVVANNPVAAQLLYGPGQGQIRYGPEAFLTPGTYPIIPGARDPVSGIRFRSWIAGSPAQVFGLLYYAGEPSLGSGQPFTSIVSASGSVTEQGQGMTPISEIDLSVTTIFTGIPASYRVLKLIYFLRSPNAYVVDNNYIRLNADAGPNYDYARLRGNNSIASAAEAIAQTELRIGVTPGSLATANQFAAGEILIPGYTSATVRKSVSGRCGLIGAAAAADIYDEITTGLWRSLAAINSITLVAQGGGAYASGSFAILYGLAGPS